MRPMRTFTVLTAGEISNLERRKAVIARDITETLEKMLNICFYKMLRAMLIIIR